MHRFSRLQLGILNTLAVAISILVAYGVQKLLTSFSTASESVTTLLFALSLPFTLLLLQIGIRWLDHHQEFHFLTSVRRQTKLNTETIRTLKQFYSQLLKQLTIQWEVTAGALYVFDWQRNCYVQICPTDSTPAQILSGHHALVRYAKQYQTVYCTERQLPQEDELSDSALAEISTFMTRHQYVLALPLATQTDVYGFIFFKLSEIKDTKLFAQNRFENLTSIGQQFGTLLHKVLIYDAIVLGKNL